MTNPPSIQSLGDIYTLTWDQEKVKIQVDRILEDSRSLSGEMTISLNSGGSLLHLYHGRLNLLAGTAKKGLVRELEDYKEIGVDWHSIIEQTCLSVLKHYRRGAPVIRVGNLPPRTEPRYRLYPYIIEGELSALYGFGGSLKSYVATLISVIIQCGANIIGFKPIKGNTLTLDWETSKQTVDERVKAIKKGMNITSTEEPFYRQCTRRLTYDLAEIQRSVLENDIKLVIVDSVGMASGLEGEYHNQALELLRALRSLGISGFLIDHKPKHGETMFGSIYKYNEVRTAFEIRAKQNPGDSFLNVAIHHAKVNDAALTRPCSFHIDFYGDENVTDKVVFKRQEISEIPELAEGLPLRERIMGLLKGVGLMSVEDIAEELNINEPSVRTTLNRNKEIFTKVGTQWGVLIEGA